MNLIPPRVIAAAQSLPAHMVSDYQNSMKGVRNVIGVVKSNIDQGQKNLKPGAPQSNAINPLKGTGAAFMSAFKS